ncbi:D-2-hydroxyacid dehydrogenase [Pelagibius sp. Alg239-R121]|uniref:D-2-hydroxyacid dehydrogenase n=1 Tax=Pelagibius sp. Alg239-R121 TaxID=2993448 RepID=UPI0024A643E4|nr:D-2-hydroxyacid dehydrogenase [Pelagibius sp. Alg239-R121]
MSEPDQDVKVVVHDAEPAPLIDELRRHHPDVSVMPCDSYDGLGAVLESFRPDVVFTVRFAGTPNFPTRELLGLSGPKWISVGGSGVDHLGQWDSRKTTVTNAAGVAAGMMAEYVMGSILHFTLDVPGLERDRENRIWAGRMMTPIEGKNLLIVGLGHSGEAIAKRAKAFGLRVTGVRAHPRATANVDQVYATGELKNLWADADFIVICAPLLEATRGLVNAAAFKVMKPGAVLVDISRGGIVCHSALLDALQSQRLAGAALDVFETEPLPAENPLWQLNNVLISPHCSSVFKGWELASVRMFADNLTRWRKGEALFNLVDPARGY